MFVGVKAVIFALNIEEITNISELLPYASITKRRQLDHFIDKKEGLRVLTADLLTRAVICKLLNQSNYEIEFITNEYGKPFLKGHEGFHFNKSHSGKWVVCAIDNYPIGVDIEEVGQIDWALIESFFSTEEIGLMKNQPGAGRTSFFYELWTLKESYIKALGYGLSIPLNSFYIKFENNSKSSVYDLNNHQRVYLQRIQFEQGYKLASCSFCDVPIEVTQVNLSWVLNELKPKHIYC